MFLFRRMVSDVFVAGYGFGYFCVTDSLGFFIAARMNVLIAARVLDVLVVVCRFNFFFLRRVLSNLFVAAWFQAFPLISWFQIFSRISPQEIRVLREESHGKKNVLNR